MRLLITVFVILAPSSNAFACFSPRGGSEYDSLITIEPLDGAGHFKVSVPTRLERNLKEAQVMLAYSSNGAKGVPVYEPFELLKTKNEGELSVAQLALSERESGQPYIVVMWWHKRSGQCGVQANSKYISAAK